MEEVLFFKDLGFKLLVINELMNQGLLPKFDLDKFVASEAFNKKGIETDWL